MYLGSNKNKLNLKYFLIIFGFFLNISCTNDNFNKPNNFFEKLNIIKIMPLGDSITQGIHINSKNIGYRRDLYQILTDNGFRVDFVGSMNDGSISDFDKDHEGHSGYRANQIRDSIYNWLVINPADIILLHIGTNDINGGEAPFSISLEINSIFNQIDLYEKEYNKSIKVIAAKIINHQLYPGDIKKLNNYMSDIVKERRSRGDNIIIADMFSILNDENDFLDNVHPNESGYKKMAELWIEKIAEIWIENF